jgi:hypothetical protein
MERTTNNNLYGARYARGASVVAGKGLLPADLQVGG